MEDYFRLKLFLDYIGPAICLGILGASALIMYAYFSIKDVIHKTRQHLKDKKKGRNFNIE